MHAVTDINHVAKVQYDANGNRVVGQVGGVTARHLGNWCERKAPSNVYYYHVRGQRIAQRKVYGRAHFPRRPPVEHHPRRPRTLRG